MAGPLRRTVTIVNEKGLHARAAAALAKTAVRFNARLEVTKGGVTVSARSIMGLMMLAAVKGAELELSAEGPDAEAALDALEAVVSSGFGE